MTRIRLTLAAIALFAVWPLIHGAVTRSRASGFTPWKLMGFGMFAEPHVYRNHLGVLVAPKGQATPTAQDPLHALTFWRDLGPHREPFEAAIATDAGWIPLDVASSKSLGARPGGTSLGTSAPGADYRARVTDAQCFYNSPRALGDLVASTLATVERPSRAVVLVSKPHLGVGRRVHYAETCVFAYDDGAIQQLGCDSDVAEIRRLALLGLSEPSSRDLERQASR